MTAAEILSRTLEGFLLWGSGAAFFQPLPRRGSWQWKALAMVLPSLCISFATPMTGQPIALIAGLGLLYLFLFGSLCWETGRSVILYCSLWGMQLYILTYELSQFAGYSASQGAGLLLRVLLALSAYLSVGYTVSLWMPIYRQRHAGPRQSVTAVMLYVIFVALTYGFFHDGRFRLQGMLDLILFMAQFYCIIVLYLQAALFQNSAIQHERDMIELIWRKQKAQYEQSKQSIATINQKTHDLKHQLAAMRTMESSRERERYIREIQDSVDIYDSMVKTGNETLDTVLTEKSLYCKAHSITVTCVADGERLAFMDPVDLYTLMGNAMDNAIEAVQQLGEKSLRTIDVLIYQRQSLLIISVTNPLKEALVLEDGIPASTKPADGYHGFGVRSMRSTARKYGGELTVDTRDGCFSLNLVFPLKKE